MVHIGTAPLTMDTFEPLQKTNKHKLLHFEPLQKQWISGIAGDPLFLR